MKRAQLSIASASGTPLQSPPSTPKRAIAWKELSVLLKSGEKENSRPKPRPKVTIAESRPERVANRKKPSAIKTPLASSSKKRKPNANASVNSALPSPGRVARLRQSQVARRMLESISPDMFMSKKKLVGKSSSAVMSPAVTKYRLLHRTPPRAPASGRRRILPEWSNSRSVPATKPSSPIAKSPRSLAMLRSSLKKSPMRSIR